MGSDEDRPANLYERSHLWLLPVVRSDRIHRPGDGTGSGRLVPMATRTRDLSLLGRRGCLVGHEWSAVGQHPVHDDGELPG